MESPILRGVHVRLEPLGLHHVAPLAAASAEGGELYAMSMVPHGEDAVRRYVETALAWKAAGTAEPFATVRQGDDAVIGSTRFFDLARWAWPSGHPNSANAYDTCEIGYTWLAPDAIRTAANTEAKYLMLAHAFEVWKMQSVCLHTDARNTRSRAAIERIGARFEGILRSHRLAADVTPRDSARYSIVAREWAETKAQIERLLVLR
ncbi:MAG TPA: GNAT family protein [Candidatus Acidoferrales bacterium]|nr:GNAT family protein [Candidatus Acidoferrales bacterium]